MADPGKLRLTTRVNGVTKQDSSTGDMIFDVPTLISDLSRGMTLLPGTVILVGGFFAVALGTTGALMFLVALKIAIDLKLHLKSDFPQRAKPQMMS